LSTDYRFMAILTLALLGFVLCGALVWMAV
jgi:hypothetical protein